MSSSLGAKRKKSSAGAEEAGSAGAPAFAASSPASPPASPMPFVFSAGTGSPQRPAAPAPAESPADEAAEAATQRLVEACRAGDPAALAARLPAVADVNRPARQGAAAGFAAPPLWWAAETGQPECVRLLLEAGANIEARPAPARRARCTTAPRTARPLRQPARAAPRSVLPFSPLGLGRLTRRR
jgi:hypothetical protein